MGGKRSLQRLDLKTLGLSATCDNCWVFIFFSLVKHLKNITSILILKAIQKEAAGWIWSRATVYMTWKSRRVRYHCGMLKRGVIITLCFGKISLALWEVYWSLMGQEAVVVIQTGNDEVLNEVRSHGTGEGGE